MTAAELKHILYTSGMVLRLSKTPNAYVGTLSQQNGQTRYGVVDADLDRLLAPLYQECARSKKGDSDAR